MATAASFTQLYGRRFSEEEQMAFGRWSHLNVRANFAETAGRNLGLRTNSSRPPSGLQESRSMARRCSEPTLGASSPGALQRSKQGCRSVSAPRSPEATSGNVSPRQAPTVSTPKFDDTSLRSVLDQLWPAEDIPSCKKERKVRRPKSAALPLEDAPQASLTTTTTPLSPVSQILQEGTPVAREKIEARTPPRSLRREQHQSRSTRQRMQVLERFRWHLLQRFRSLFDAFTRLHDLATRENALIQDEFIQAFAQLGVTEKEALEVFAAMDYKGKQIVSLAELRTVLVTSSKQALLWELRCRLLTQGITSSDFSKVKKILMIARRPRHRTVRQRRRPLPYAWAGHNGATLPVQEDPNAKTLDVSPEGSEVEWAPRGEASYAWAENLETRTGFLPSSARLSRTDWLHVCSAIGLTLLESEKLFEILVNCDTQMVDLQDMFTVLRAGVAPHVSLERFATRVLTRYGSLQGAFAAACSEAGSVVEDDEKASGVAGMTVLMAWPEFQSLAVALDVSDFNAEGLWAALTLAQRSSLRESEAGHIPTLAIEDIKGTSTVLAKTSLRSPTHDDRSGVITEATFVKELTVWAPGTALGALRHQVDEHFSDLCEFRYALGQTGSSLSAPVSPNELDIALLAVGITCCDVERVCSAVQSASRGALRGSSISLDDVVEALRTSSRFSGGVAKSAVRDDLRPFWQKLHNVQADLKDLKVLKNASPIRLCTSKPEAEVKHVSGKRKCCGSGIIRSSASLPSLRSAAGLRLRLARQSRGKRGSVT